MKSNQILIGIIMVLIGVFSLVRKFIGFDLSALTILAAGLAFLLLYWQKKAVWALFVGGYMSCFGLFRCLSMVGLNFLSGPQTMACTFFIVPGAIFILLYFDKNKRGLLVPGCILLWLGIGFILNSIFSPGISASLGMMVAYLGFSFCTIYLIGRSHISRGLLHMGVILTIIGGLLSGGLISLVGGASRLASGVLIAIGLLIIIRGILSNSRR